jgi:signal recognition particle receptor subunit beta
MARIDEKRHDLALTLVVYGAPKVGKTTILHSIQDRVSPERRGVLVPFGSDAELAPMLDWLPLELGLIGGWHTSVNLYAIPDQRHADATRRLILADADGVLFAADAQAGRVAENISALRSMRDNLDDPDGRSRVVPTVFVYTKCDLPAELLLTRAALNAEFNPGALPDFLSSAVHGVGVLEALHTVISVVMKQYGSRAERQG